MESGHQKPAIFYQKIAWQLHRFLMGRGEISGFRLACDSGFWWEILRLFVGLVSDGLALSGG